MCGIVGFFSRVESKHAYIAAMTNELIHRGPDSFGLWVDNTSQIAMGHRRLSIVDLSESGAQPFVSSCGRYVLCYNGEIYNHLRLREELEASPNFDGWRGHSDTETLVASIRHWGVEQTLPKLNGMFAFALWDRNTQKLYLARDRFGEKPLYYGRANNSFLFASELKAMEKHPDWEGKIERDALALFMRYNNIPAPYSIFKGIYKLLPAHYVVVTEHGTSIGAPVCYWSLEENARLGIGTRGGNPHSYADELDSLLRDAVAIRMASDVPVGAFLSGGYDSTMIVAAMQAQSTRPVRTFSIGNEATELNEAPYAAAVARYLGTDHTELYITDKDAIDIIPLLPAIYDEPFADSSQIPTFLVSRLARREVTVALSGDGGDELFAGYNRHGYGVKFWSWLQNIPRGMRRALSRFVIRMDNPRFAGVFGLLGTRSRVPALGLKLSKLGAAMAADDGIEFYDLLRAHWPSLDPVVGASPLAAYVGNRLDGADLLDQFIFMDMQTYLPDDLLTKVDRASMAVGLEARAPFLDPRLVQFAWGVPLEFKVKNGIGKWLLRELVHRYVPKKLMHRPKQGFGIPVGAWLKGPLRAWAEDLLDKKRLKDENYLRIETIHTLWESHLAGRGNHEHRLWCVLMFQAWLDQRRR